MSNRTIESLESRINSLTARLNSFSVLVSAQELRKSQENNNLNRFSEIGITNPLEQNINGNNFNIESIKNFSATNGKFTTLKVGNNNITPGKNTFLDLTDTPRDFDNSAGKVVKVNTAENALVFGDSTSITTFTDLTDTPSELKGAADAGKFVKVDASGEGLVFEDSIPGTFSGLTDTPQIGESDADKFVKINSAGTELVYEDPIPGTFDGLSDTPPLSITHADKFVKVDASGEGLVFEDSIPGTFSGLTDTPPLSITHADKFVKVDASGEGLVFEDSIPGRFLELQDTPANFNDAAGKSVKVNAAGTALVYGEAGQNPPTVANPTAAASGSEKPSLGSNIKDLINHGCHVNWTQSGDSIYGIGAEMHLGGSSLANLPSADRDDYKQALECVSISNNGKFIAIGAPNASQSSGNDDGMVFLYECVNGHWVLLATCGKVQYLAQPSSTYQNSGSRFGFSVAINGDAGRDNNNDEAIILAVGSINESGQSRGGVHVFRLDDGPYRASGRPSAILAPDDDNFPDSTSGNTQASFAFGANGGDRLGLSVALNGSGKIMAVGSAGGAGVRIYRRRAANLTLTTRYAGGAVSSDPKPNEIASWYHYQNIGVGGVPNVTVSDDFGFSVALSNDGQYLAATSIKDSPGSTQGDSRGFIRVHHINYTVAGDGSETAAGREAGSGRPHTLHPANAVQTALEGDDDDELGYSVKISDDGNRIAVGSVREQYVKVFSTTGVGSAWTQLGNTIKPTLIDTTAIGGSAATVDDPTSPPSPIRDLVYFNSENTFGESIGMNNTGDIIIVGASKSTQPYQHQGLARVFSLDNDSGNLLKWNQLGQTILGLQSKRAPYNLGSRLGMCVSMNAEGNIFAVSSPGDGDPRYANYITTDIGAGFEGHLDTASHAEVYNQHNTGSVKIFHLKSSLPAIDITRLVTFLDYFKT